MVSLKSRRQAFAIRVAALVAALVAGALGAVGALGGALMTLGIGGGR